MITTGDLATRDTGAGVGGRMAHAALVALAWVAAAATASAAHYADYHGVKMPQYGPSDYESAREPARAVVAVDDYHGHSQDASSSLDYKFEEDIHSKLEKPLRESDDRDIWSKSARRHRKLEKMRKDETLETLHKYDAAPDEKSKIKMSRHSPEYRPRNKSRKSRRDGSSRQRSVMHNLKRNDRTDSDIEYFQRNDDIYQANEKEIDNSMDNYWHTQASARIIRRKPRDRHIQDRSGDDREDALQPNRRMTHDRRNEPEYMVHEMERDRTSDRESYRPMVEDEDTATPTGHWSKAYVNYGDYYDMKRVHNIKNKLPTLLRRTSARVTPPTVTSTNVLDALKTHRRTARPVPPAPAGAVLSVVPLPPLTSTIATTASLVVSTASALRKAIVTQAAPNNASEMISLAEKSRLSILKKAQRKEKVRSDSSTLKPPVLLQVTDKKLTVVVVEPPTSEGPWMRAREVTMDTPERVDRAKRLMRRKLVARAKNIQDLTDNWDEMICDYIDVSLLDSAALAFFPSYPLLAFVFVLLTV